MMEHDGDHLPIPMPITSKYMGDHHHQPHPLSHHHHHLHHGLSSPHDHSHIHSSNGPTPPPPSAITPKVDVHHYNSAGGPNHGGGVTSSKATGGGGGSASGVGVRYRECLKNHAASIGGTALDGCGEFMPAGEDGTMEALKCSACGCHRNFHRKEQEGSGGSAAMAAGAGDLAVAFDYYAAAHPQHYFKPMSAGSGRKVVGQKGVLYHDYPYGQPPPLPLLPLPSPHGHPHHHHHHHMAPMPLGAMQATSESDEMDGGGGFPSGGPTPPALMKKRFRTKFTVEQKERMLEFAERSGWRLQRTEEAVVQQFCQEIGVKRRVLKVWMHNNKHNLARRGVALGGLDVGGAATSAGGGSDGGGAHDHNGDNSSNSHSHSHGDVNPASVQIHLHPLDHHQHQQQRHGC